MRTQSDAPTGDAGNAAIGPKGRALFVNFDSGAVRALRAVNRGDVDDVRREVRLDERAEHRARRADKLTSGDVAGDGVTFSYLHLPSLGALARGLHADDDALPPLKRGFGVPDNLRNFRGDA